MADIGEVIKALENTLLEKIFDGEFVLLSAYIIADALELLKEQPQIVRCKDCRLYKEGCCSLIDDSWSNIDPHMEPDGFCSKAERKG